MMLLTSCLCQLVIGYIREFTSELQPQSFLLFPATEWLQGHSGTRLVTHRSQLYTSVHIRTGGFSSISCSGRNRNKISCSFLGFCHLPSTLLGNRVWSPFAQGDIRLCPLPRLEKPFSSPPCFSQAPSSFTSSM